MPVKSVVRCAVLTILVMNIYKSYNFWQGLATWCVIPQVILYLVWESIKPGTERNRKYLLYNTDVNAGHVARNLRLCVRAPILRSVTATKTGQAPIERGKYKTRNGTGSNCCTNTDVDAGHVARNLQFVCVY